MPIIGRNSPIRRTFDSGDGGGGPIPGPDGNLLRTPAGQPRHVRMAIVGSGFAGLCMAIKLKQAGRHDFVILERADAVGGTWRDNTYPGCECDVPSHLYSYSFEPYPDWPRPFACQSDIRDYTEHCFDKYGIRPHVQLRATLERAEWDDARKLWRIQTSAGAFTADMIASGMGGLSNPLIPDFPGLDRFQGASFHSARWDHDYDFEGKRVAVIGTGASTIQFLPEIAPKAAHLTLFQRTPAWVLPKRNAPYSARQKWVFRNVPLAQRLHRARIFTTFEAFGLAFRRPRTMNAVRKQGIAHIEQYIDDPELRKLLTPDYTPGCKRILMSNKYYPALARDNVSVTGSGIREVREHSIVTEDGVEHEVDVIVFGTGFDIMRERTPERIVGRDGVELHELWHAQTPEAYLGTLVAGFPNLFMLGGPNSGLGHNSIIFMLEGAVRQTMMAIEHMEAQGKRTVEVRKDAQDRYNEEVQRKLATTVWNTGCSSYYRNDDGKIVAIWPGSAASYRLATRKLREQDLLLD
ncbi:MAG: NAD(P)/FAD-dependent oxidoreductase [Myxococcales bacterium]|jgi:cation diffusion facilitator CzcD-associated flavoprotein CzcO